MIEDLIIHKVKEILVGTETLFKYHDEIRSNPPSLQHHLHLSSPSSLWIIPVKVSKVDPSGGVVVVLDSVTGRAQSNTFESSMKERNVDLFSSFKPQF